MMKWIRGVNNQLNFYLRIGKTQSGLIPGTVEWLSFEGRLMRIHHISVISTPLEKES